MKTIKQPLLSVIVPVYNAEQYLNQCIDSILSQSYSNFELILVNDGSKDSSLEICNFYSKTDDRVKVFDFINQGVSAARRYGLSEARGEWITFIDSDDTIPSHTFENMINLAVQYNPEIIMGSWRRISINNKTHITLLGAKGFISSEDYSKSLLSGSTFAGPVGKYFRKDIITIKDLEMSSSIKQNEDLIMNLRIASKVNSVYCVPQIIVYNYWQRSNSASSKKTPVSIWNDVYQIMLDINTSYKVNIIQYFINLCFRQDLFKEEAIFKKPIIEYKSSLSPFSIYWNKINLLQNKKAYISKIYIEIHKRLIQLKKVIKICIYKIY